MTTTATAQRPSHPLDSGIAPSWASEIGEDQWAPFASLEIDGVVERMRWIPPGDFQMGSPESENGRYGDEGPVQNQSIAAGFWMMETPVTQELWQAVMGENPSYFKSGKRPVEQVSWDDGQGFIEKLNSRLDGLKLCLPSEAQWEYACRVGTQTATYVGDLEIAGDYNAPGLDEIAWYSGNCGVDFDLADGQDMTGWSEKQYEFSIGGTREVKQKKPNGFGLYDMLGSVWEWCEDYWREGYEAEFDPSFRVVRGGSWFSDARYVRAACRCGSTPDDALYDIGFRCVEFKPELQQESRERSRANSAEPGEDRERES
ncbi:MAG: formylglycine-generating enzyme family protein [Planctomycetota bacterium]